MNFTIIKFLVQLRNASLLRREKIEVVYNRKFLQIIKVLYKEGLVQAFRRCLVLNTLSVYLRFVVVGEALKVLSKSSRIILLSKQELSKIFDVNKIFIFSTDQGLHTLLECKRRLIGGKLLFSI